MRCIKFLDFWSFFWLKEKKIVTLQANCAKRFITNNFNIFTTMKMNKIFSAIMLMVAVAFSACEQPPVVGPGGPGSGNNGGDTTSTVVGQGQGTLESPFTADDVIALNGSKTGVYYVEAYIVGQIAGKSLTDNAEFTAPFSGSTNDDGSVNAYNTNLLIASAAGVTDVAKCVPVQLPSGALRSGLNLVENPDMLGQKILIYGSLEKYYGAPGIKNPSYAKVGDKKFGIDPSVEQKEPEAKVVTVAEFIAAPESTEVYYELTGTIGGTINTQYGNFDLTDETGTVYVYGLTKEFIAVGSTSNDNSYASLGLNEGDKITLRGFRGSYKGKIEVMGAYFVKLVSKGEGGNDNPGGNTGGTTPEGAIVFTPMQDKGNAGSDSQNATAFEITKNGVTLACSQGVVSSQGDQYRFFKNQTVTISSTVGNITSIEFTCTANDDAKYGPGCFTVVEGTYAYEGKVGTWTGDASEVTFTASTNQVRATQIVVVVE